MENIDIYRDISERTGGDIYVGVVGPVRTGKSTFIKRFMDTLVVPNIENSYSRERAIDELPQSAGGKTIMTTEPKFVPNEAVKINIDDNLSLKVRMIDCVGYLIPDATGHLDGNEPRMVSTPWSDEKMPFAEAAEKGTRKVITDHSTIGIVITTDGSATAISRENYEEAEQRVIDELKQIDKPFIVVLNTTKPYSPETAELKQEMDKKYGISVIPANCAQLKAEDINNMLENLLYEFPVGEVKIELPKWVETLPSEHYLKQSLIATAKNMLRTDSLREIKNNVHIFEENEYIKKAYMDNIELGTGSASLEVSLNDELFYKVLGETTGMEIENEYSLISTIKLLSQAKREYDKVKYALEEVKRKGYGVVMPTLEEMELDKPEVIKNGARYGIKIRATAPSFHLVKADIKTEITPIVGSEEQSKELVEYLVGQYESSPENIWEYNIFGKTLSDLVNDGMQSKLYNIPEDAQMKLQETLQKIINEGNGGLICIML